MLWGGKVILSTGTKNLQDQLFLRDIPTVRKALNVPISVSLLKGRANYLCHYHLERAQANGRLASKQDAAWLRDIARFAKTTTSGDKAELAAVPENAPVWQLVTSTRDNCPGQRVPAVQGMLRDARPQGGAAGRRGGGEPSPVLCRCGAA